MNQKLSTTEKRIDTNQKLLLEQFRKVPIVQSACEKLNIGRASYYRWKAENKEFSRLADEALLEGALLVNDWAESQILSAIRDVNLTATIYWLNHHHPAYTNKLELTHKTSSEDLSSDQKLLIKKAIELTQSVEFKKRKEEADEDPG